MHLCLRTGNHCSVNVVCYPQDNGHRDTAAGRAHDFAERNFRGQIIMDRVLALLRFRGSDRCLLLECGALRTEFVFIASFNS
jgi:hypothetical protein